MKATTSVTVLLAAGLVFGNCTCDSTTGGANGDGGAHDGALGDGARDTGVAPDGYLGQPDGGPPPVTIPPECAAAADRGIAWLLTKQLTDGSWGLWPGGDSYPLATTGFAVLKLETHAYQVNRSPFDPSFEYYTPIVNGLRYLLSWAKVMDIRTQQAGNPDTNGNGKGVAYQDAMMYENSIALMAIAAGRDPVRVVDVPGSDVNGWTYGQVVQDMVDYLAFAQSDPGGAFPWDCPRGGWRYEAIDNATEGDNSVSQFVTLALEYAEHPDFNYHATIPAFVKTELGQWVTCIQDATASAFQGGSGYTAPDEDANAYKTGALIQQATVLGEDKTAPRVQAAMGFLSRYWADVTGVGWRSSPGEAANYLAMYSIMKGMESIAVDDLNGIDWYRDFCNVLIEQQNPDGSWPPSMWEAVEDGDAGLLSTEWALLVLERAAPPPPVID